MGTINISEIDDGRRKESGRVGLLLRTVKFFPHWQAMSYEIVMDLIVVLAMLDNNR